MNELFESKSKELLKFDFVDKVFTVYADCEGVEINCGARNCFECHKCYTKNKTEYINEKLK